MFSEQVLDKNINFRSLKDFFFPIYQKYFYKKGR